MDKNEEATKTFRRTLEDSSRPPFSLGDAILLALWEATQVAGTRRLQLTVTDGDLATAEVSCG